MTNLKNSMGRISQTGTSGQSRHRLAKTVCRPRVGQLLLESGILKPHNLQHALNSASSSSQPVGHCLVQLGYVTEQTLESALVVQTLISEGAITELMAIKAVREAGRRGTKVEEILKEIENEPIPAPNNLGLGELLIGAGIITATVHDEVQKISQESGILFGRTLLLTHSVSAPILNSALTLLILMRDDQVTKEQATKMLRKIACSQQELKEVAKVMQVKLHNLGNKPRLGEMLATSRTISESEAAIAVERALSEKRMLGDILVNSGVIPVGMLEDALKLQQLVARSVLSSSQAGELLRLSQAQRKPLTDVIDTTIFKDDPAQSTVIQLLKRARIISDHDIAKAVAEVSELRMDSLKALLASGRLLPTTYHAAINSIQLIKRKLLTEDQAIIAIDICERTRCDLSHAFSQMGLELGKEPETQTEDEPAQDCSTQVRSTIRDWNSYNEFRWLLVLIAVVLVANLGTAVLCTKALGIVIFGSLILLSLGLMHLGTSWKSMKEQRKEEKAMSLQLAQETKQRLKKQS